MVNPTNFLQLTLFVGGLKSYLQKQRSPTLNLIVVKLPLVEPIYTYGTDKVRMTYN